MTTLVTAVTVGTTSTAAAVPAKSRGYLGIFNQSTSATIYVGLDAPPVAAATAGQITLLPVTGANKSSVEFSGSVVPASAIWLISTAGSTPATIIDG